MSTLVLPSRRRHALSATAALVGGLLAAMPAQPAAAATTGTVSTGTLSWGISTYINSANPGRPNPRPESYVAPATFDAATRISTFGTASGAVAANLSATLQLDGTSVNYAPTSGAWLKIADPEVSLDTSGNGTVTALVSYGRSPGTNPVPYDDTTPLRPATRIDMVVLSGNTAGDRAGTATQTTWTGLDGAWSPAFVDFLDGDTGIDPWVYAATFTGAADRVPSPMTFSAQTAVPAVNASITSSNPTSGVTVNVAGTGFRAVTNPGDSGLYAGIAPSGGLPDVSTPAGQAAFAVSAYIAPGAIVDGAFTRSMTATKAALDPSKTYSVYTWQAHTHSNTTQDTETPISINFSTLLAPSAVTPGGAATTSYGAPLTVTAAVSGPGSVTLSGVGASQTATVANGSVSFMIPGALPAGSYTAAFGYSGSASHAPSSATRAITVTKATPVLASKVLTKPSADKRGKRGKLRVSAAGVAGATAPSGKVVLVLKRNGVKEKVQATLVDGVAKVKLPELGTGGWTLTVRFVGDANYGKSKLTKPLEVTA